MKKIAAIILALVLCLSLAACGNKGSDPKKAYENSKEAFDLITTAYIETKEFSEDIYEAWRLGINSSSSYNDEYELSSFASEMNIGLADIKKGVASLLGKDAYSYGDWKALPPLFGNSYFSAWVTVISEAYKCSGDVDIIKTELESAKGLMKELSSSFSDYEHYPSLKKYFTNTVAFFNFCCDPEGTFEQVVDTINTYRNNSREYFFDLHYVFGDSIGGFEEYLENKEFEEAATEESTEEAEAEEATTIDTADVTTAAA